MDRKAGILDYASASSAITGTLFIVITLLDGISSGFKDISRLEFYLLLAIVFVLLAIFIKVWQIEAGTRDNQ